MVRGTRRALLVALASCLLTSACGQQLVLRASSSPDSFPARLPVEQPSPSPSWSASATPSATPSSTAPSPEPTPDVTLPTSPADLVPVVHSINTRDPVVFITIDDGYSKDPAVIALLRERKVAVTPFLTRSAVVDRPSYFADLEKATGQVPQDHTLTHPFLSRKDAATQKREICGAADQYADWFGTRPWLFRPPYGDYSTTTRRAAKQCGMTAMVLWDVSLPHSVLRFASGSRFRKGDILLVHWRPNLARDLAMAIDTIEAQGLRVAALQDYLPRPA